MMFALPLRTAGFGSVMVSLKCISIADARFCNTGVNKDYASRTSNGCFNRDQWETSGVEAAQRRGKNQGATSVVSRLDCHIF